MPFNLNNARVDPRSAEDALKKQIRRKIKKIDDKNFNVYVVRMDKLVQHKYSTDFNLQVWSKVDRRYVYNTYTNDWEIALGEVLKIYKRGKCNVINLLEATKKDIVQKYELR